MQVGAAAIRLCHSLTGEAFLGPPLAQCHVSLRGLGVLRKDDQKNQLDAYFGGNLVVSERTFSVSCDEEQL